MKKTTRNIIISLAVLLVLGAAAAVLIPALELALGNVLPNATVGLLGCAAFFVPIIVAGKLNE